MRIFASAALLLLSACAVGPDYQRPAVATPDRYKEQDGWKSTTPQEAASDTAWWSRFDDPVLDALERQVVISNQTVKESEAAYRQAVAAADVANASFFPTLSGNGSGTRGKSSTSLGKVANVYDGSLSASWTLDVWGKLRRSAEAADTKAEGSAADLAAALLSAQGSLASDYFSLRAEDELKRLLDSTAEAYAQTLRITRNQYAAGLVGLSDVKQAESQLETTRAQAVNVGVTRAQLEHAIAVLTGKPPAEFSIAAVATLPDPPDIPLELPSALLERRPDIAAEERRMASANASVGVAIGAFFPTVTLSGSDGASASKLGNLLKASSGVWSFGPQLAGTLFDGGALSGQLAEARASYDQQVATYRKTVLSAFQGVEDELAAVRILAQQAEVEERAVAAAMEAERLILNQYKAGTIAYTSVVTAQASALSARQSALTIRQNRLTASVLLIQDLGGGWDVRQLAEPIRTATVGKDGGG